MSVKDIELDAEGLSKLPINEFKLTSMVQNPSIIMIAKRGSGKSWICRAILNHFKDVPVGIIIAKTDKMNSFYGDFFPDAYIHYEYRSEIIEKVLYRQMKMLAKQKEKKKQGKFVDARAFIVMDDCLSSKGSWVKDKPIAELLFDGRHYHLMYILTMQYPLGITPELRCNFDYVFLMAEDFTSNMKRIYDHYAGQFPDFNSFKQVFNQLTQDYGAMVITNRGARRVFLEKIFWYKAPNFSGVTKEEAKIGCKQFREFHNRNYNESWRDKSKPFEFNEWATKKKREKVELKIDKVVVDDENSHRFNNNNNFNRRSQKAF